MIRAFFESVLEAPDFLSNSVSDLVTLTLIQIRTLVE
jgi:hypothetical protein